MRFLSIYHILMKKILKLILTIIYIKDDIKKVNIINYTFENKYK